MKCVLCGDEEALRGAVICLKCLAENIKSSGKYVMMRVIYDMLKERSMTSRDISEVTKVDRGTIRNYLNFMLEKGLVKKRWILVRGKWAILWEVS